MKAFFKHSIYAALLAVPLLTGCSNQDGAISDEMVPLQVYAEIEDSDTETRATEKTAWTNEDAIGVICTTNSDFADNAKFIYSSNEWNAENGVYFTSKNSFSFKAYYPYVSDPTTAQTDENDWMYADATTASASSPTASFTFKHVMSKLTITLCNFSSDVKTFTVSGLKTGGSYTPSSNTINEATGTASDRTFTSGTAVVIYPQSSTTQINITLVDGVDTYYAAIYFDDDYGIESGYEYIYEIIKK